MIESWTLKNFKSVQAETTLAFAPLTIFAGANSSGKSTLIQSLLLTAQTLQSPVYSRSVILNGHIVRLGTFDDIVSNGHSTEHIGIGFKLSPSQDEMLGRSGRVFGRFYATATGHEQQLLGIECSFTFSAGTDRDKRETLRLQPRLERLAVKSSARVDGETIRDEDVVIERTAKPRGTRLTELKLSAEAAKDIEPGSLEYSVIAPTTLKSLRNYYRLPESIRPISATFRHFLPDRFLGTFDVVQEECRRSFEALLGREDDAPDLRDAVENTLLSSDVQRILLEELQSVVDEARLPAHHMPRVRDGIAVLRNDFSFTQLRQLYRYSSLLRRAMSEKLIERQDEIRRYLRGSREPDYRITASPLPQTSDAAVEYIQQYFTRLVKYLGPLRDEPKPVYPLAGATDPKDVGYRGEHTAAVLELHKNTVVKYVPSEQFCEGQPTTRPSLGTLHKSVLDWLQYMGIVSDVRTFERGSLGHELHVSTPGGSVFHDLTHVGVGVSQVLPILVLSLLAESGSVLIFEQPELHLHPRVQTRLADFFVSMTTLGKQCIVETHSEYLINQLRYRAAVSHDDAISKSVIMYFVEKQGPSSKYRTIRINRFGVIEDWPKGFFDENEENASRILRAGVMKRKQEGAHSNAYPTT